VHSGIVRMDVVGDQQKKRIIDQRKAIEEVEIQI
jgi:hypothetical protein